jgi:mRNA interferase RelE/StbE
VKVEIRKRFQKDCNLLTSDLLAQIAEVVEQIEHATAPHEISACKKLKGFKTAYRIRMGDYRIGFFFENGIAELVRIMHRSEIYRYFP